MPNYYIHKCSSYKESEKFDAEYYSSLSEDERLSIVQDLREQMKYFSGEEDECPKGLRRTVKIVQRK